MFIFSNFQEPRKEHPRPEPRKQAKVKPMSASDEKMIDDAIAMANELTSIFNFLRESTLTFYFWTTL
jgi:hypothetical protein